MIELLQTIVICFTVLGALFLILLALPKSHLRSVFLEICGWLGAGTSAVAVVSPVDMIPEVLFPVGMLDDVAYLVVGILCALFAYRQRINRH